MSAGLNAEAVLASIIELRDGMAKETSDLRASIAELRDGMAKETSDLRASIAELREETKQANAELRTSMAKETSDLRASIVGLQASIRDQGKRIDMNTSSVGSLVHKLGGIVESIVIPGIVEKFNEKGFGFDSVSTNVEFFNEDKTANVAEVDALLENGSFVIAVEAKTDMRVGDVDDHIKRLDALRKISRFNGKKIYGAFATAVARKHPVNYALEQGIYVLQQPDVMGVKILDFPKGHTARAW